MGVVQFASFQLCPLGSPSVAPQEQVFGVVQVAELKLCVCGGSVVGAVVGAIVGSIVDVVLDSVVGVVVVSLVGAVDSNSVWLVCFQLRNFLSK